MKSIFFIVLFIVMAAAMSQPDRSSSAKFNHFKVSMPGSLNQATSLKKSIIDIRPNNSERSYNISFSGPFKSTKGISFQKSNFDFRYKNCKLAQKPHLSFSCQLKNSYDIKGEKAHHLTSMSVSPLLVFGQEQEVNSPYYIVELIFSDRSGKNVSLKWFTTAENLSLIKSSKPPLALSQNQR